MEHLYSTHRRAPSRQCTTDLAKRKAYYQQAQAMIVRELPLLPLAHGMRFQASSADVEGIPLGPFGAISLANARKK